MSVCRGVYRKRGMSGLAMAKWLLSHSVATESGCIEHRGKWIHNGYSFIPFEGKTRPVSRIMFKCLYGYYPECVCHKCDNPLCLRPSHLWAGTSLENARDKVSKGRHIGTGRKLSGEIANKIRTAHAGGASYFDLSKEHGISRRSVASIINRKTWAAS